VFKDLVKNCDVVVENFRPGMMQKLGLGYDVLSGINPGLIYASISGFGTLPQYKGPYSDRPAYDIVAQAMGGLMHTCGAFDGPPTWLGIALGDIYSGVMAAYGVTLALIHRQSTGEGQYIDVSMYDNMASLAERYLTVYSLTDQVMKRGKERFIAPWGPFSVKDGYAALIVATESDWAKFCNAIGHPELIDDERSNSGPKRAENMDGFLGPIISEWFMKYTKQEVTDILLDLGMPVGPVQDSKEVFECPHIKARDLIIETNDPIVGPTKLVGSPLKLSKSPQQLTDPVPMLGEHTDEVLSDLLGYSAEKITKIKEAGAV
jgi:crotonobetainyl-CoA:carnitine CoA-transferase CaiB-like acyl-CoA transferase